MARKLSYDSECEVLARHFLSDEAEATEVAAKALAQQIQEAVEDFLQFDLPPLIEMARRHEA